MSNSNLKYVLKKNNIYISVYNDGIRFNGMFYNIYNREIVNSSKNEEFIRFNNYIGSHRLKIKSERKLNQFIIPYFIITVIKTIFAYLEKLKQPIDKFSNAINSLNYGNFTGISSFATSMVESILPFPIPLTFITIVLFILQIIVIVNLFRYLLSQKEVYEFSATNIRIGIDKNEITDKEYLILLQNINQARKTEIK